MSLTSFIQVPEVRKRLDATFPVWSLDITASLVAPPLTAHHSLVGTAFDYLFRFYVKRLNREAFERPWIAETVVDGALFEDAPQLRRRARTVISHARRAYGTYLSDGRVGEDLLRAVLYLAQLDPLAREIPDLNWIGGKLVPAFSFARPDDDDVRDLARLLSIVKPGLFKAKRVCLLNPTFGAASILVGGADADLIVDETLIEIKTSKHLRCRATSRRQLLGYYLLNMLDRVDGLSRRYKLKAIAVYHSRYGVLQRLTLSKIGTPAQFTRLSSWCERYAAKLYAVASIGS